MREDFDPTPLPLEYYQQSDVLFLSRDLLGKYLFTCIDGAIAGGIIVETEAYCGIEDRASHAFANRHTKRNASMFCQGGVAYVYQCYGIHCLFNIVTNLADIPHAVLIRALQPMCGLEIMLQRRSKSQLARNVAGGPGLLTQALGISLQHNGLQLTGPTVWVEDRGVRICESRIISSARVGVDYAGEDAQKPWRFRIRDCPWTSPAK